MQQERSPIIFDALMTGALPGDLTLGVLRGALVNDSELGAALRKHPNWKSDRSIVRVRFVWAHDDITELPDDYTLDTFRSLAASNRAKLVIDDGEGGVKRAPLEPTLT